MATQRLSLSAQGEIRYALNTPYRDGTTHGMFAPPHRLRARITARRSERTDDGAGRGGSAVIGAGVGRRGSSGCSRSRSSGAIAAGEGCVRRLSCAHEVSEVLCQATRSRSRPGNSPMSPHPNQSSVASITTEGGLFFLCPHTAMHRRAVGCCEPAADAHRRRATCRAS